MNTNNIMLSLMIHAVYIFFSAKRHLSIPHESPNCLHKAWKLYRYFRYALKRKQKLKTFFLLCLSRRHDVSGSKKLTVGHRVTAGSGVGAGADTDAVRGATGPKHTASVNATYQSTAQHLNGRGKIGQRNLYQYVPNTQSQDCMSIKISTLKWAGQD